MSRGKKGNNKRPVESSGGENIDTVTINDEQWKCCIVFVGAKYNKDVPYVQALTSVVCGMKHKKFYGLDRDKLLQIAHGEAKLAENSQSGGGGRRSKQTTTQSSGAKYMQVCEAIAGLENDDIPATTMARLLKYVVLKRRLQDLVDVEDATRQINNEDSASGKGKKAQQSSGRNSKAGKKGKNTPVSATEPTMPLPMKQPTSMLKRGQEDDTKYLCNEQGNGPNCYVIVTGIAADIIKESIVIKLPVNVLIKLEVKTDQHDDYENQPDGIAVEQLWMDIHQAVYSSPSGSVLRDLACVDLQVDLCSHFTTEHQSRSKLDCGHEILDDVIKKIYHVEKSLSHYHSYLSHLKLYEVSSSCDYQYQDTKRKRKGILSCDAVSAGVSDVLQAMIDKVECTAQQQSECELHSLRLVMQEEAASLCDMKTSTAQQDSRSHVRLTSCPTSACANSTITQSLYTRIMNEVQRNTEEAQMDDEKMMISENDLHLHLILLSLEHVCLSSASTPRNNKNGLISPCIFDQPLKGGGDTPTKSVDDFNEHISEYSSFELVSKCGVLQTLHSMQETHPYVEGFYHAPSDCRVLVAHTGYNGSRAHSYEVQAHCHSNIGVYNFLKYVDEAQYESSSEDRSMEQQDVSFADQLEGDCSNNHSAIPQLYGYNVGDTLLHLRSSFSTFFTSDGVQIHVEKQGFLENSATLSVSVLTAEGHKISCVKSDIGLDEIHSNDSQTCQSIEGLNHMLMLAFLNNGLKVATCCTGPNRTHTIINESENSISGSSPVPQRIDAETPNQEQTATSNTACTEVEAQNAKKETCQDEYHHLYATTSLGLSIHTYVTLPPKSELTSSNKAGKILVKQEYYKTAKKMPPKEVTEVHRYYLQEGLLVYIMDDESVVVYCADGGMYRTATKIECDQYHAQQSTQLVQKDHFQFQEMKNQILSISDIFGIKSKQIWLVTLPDGQSYLWKQVDASNNDGSIQVLAIEGVPCSITTDPVTKQVMITRADSVVILHNSDVQIAKFPNGTKFTSLREIVKVECPGYATIAFYMETNRCVIECEDGYQINCDSHGNYNVSDDNAMLNLSLSCQGKALYSPVSGGKYQFDFSGREIMFDAVDSSNYALMVNLQGELKTSTDCSPIANFHEAFKPRVFIINSDGTAYEAMKPAKVKEFVKDTEFGDSHNFSITNSQYESVLLMHPGSISRARADDGELKALQNCNVYNVRQFVMLEPLSVQKREAILESCQQSMSPGSKQLWQNFIKAASDFLNSNSSKVISSTKNSPHYPNSVSRALCAQRYDELQEILGAIRKSYVPVYFANDARANESHVHSKVQYLPSLLHKNYTQKIQETEMPRRLKFYNNQIDSSQQTFDATDIPKQQEQLQESHFQQTQMRLQPKSVNFGVIRKGLTYVRHIQLHNVGVHSSRFRIKSPPRSSGIKIHYSPGLIPAGLTTLLSVELCVSNNCCSDSTPSICYNLEIYFQGGQLSLPIEANIQIT